MALVNFLVVLQLRGRSRLQGGGQAMQTISGDLYADPGGCAADGSSGSAGLPAKLRDGESPPLPFQRLAVPG